MLFRSFEDLGCNSLVRVPNPKCEPSRTVSRSYRDLFPPLSGKEKAKDALSFPKCGRVVSLHSFWCALLFCGGRAKNVRSATISFPSRSADCHVVWHGRKSDKRSTCKMKYLEKWLRKTASVSVVQRVRKARDGEKEVCGRPAVSSFLSVCTLHAEGRGTREAVAWPDGTEAKKLVIHHRLSQSVTNRFNFLFHFQIQKFAKAFMTEIAYTRVGRRHTKKNNGDKKRLNNSILTSVHFDTTFSENVSSFDPITFYCLGLPQSRRESISKESSTV